MNKLKTVLCICLLLGISLGVFSQNNHKGVVLHGESLYSQLQAKEDLYPGNGFQSTQHLGDSISSYTSFAADDFTVPEGEEWTIGAVKVAGLVYGIFGEDSYNWSSISNFSKTNIIIYEDDNGKPGTKFYSVSDITIGNIEEWDANVTSLNALTNLLTIGLPSPTILPSGKYWLCVQPIIDNYQFEWRILPNQKGTPPETEFETPIGNRMHWQNPDNGHGCGYTNWTSSEHLAVCQNFWNAKDLPNLNFELFAAAEDNDIIVQSLVSPINNENLGTTEDISVTLFNNGLVDITNITVNYSINGVEYSDQDAVSIPSGEQIIHKLRKSVDLSEVKAYNFTVEVLIDNDANLSNNKIEQVVYNYGKIYPIVYEDHIYVNTNDGSITDDGGLGESDAYKGAKGVVTVYPENEGDKVILDFVEWKMKKGDSSSKLFVYNSDTVIPEKLVFAQWAMYDSVVHTEGPVIEALNTKGALTVKYESWYGGHYALDGFVGMIYNEKTNKTDFELTSLNTSEYFLRKDKTTTLSAKVRNRGTDTLAMAVSFFVNDILVNQVSSTVLTIGETDIVTYNYTPQTTGTFTIKATIPVDEVLENNVIEINREGVPLTALYESFEDQWTPEDWTNTGSWQRASVENNNLGWDGDYTAHLDKDLVDTLKTPLLNISTDDKLRFLLYGKSIDAGTIKVAYSDILNGSWTTLGEYNASTENVEEIVVDLAPAVGQNYICFAATGKVYIDYIYGSTRVYPGYDLIMEDFNGSLFPTRNQDEIFNVTVFNNGDQNIADGDYEVKIWKVVNNTNTLLNTATGVAISHLNTHTFEIPCLFTEVEEGKVYAEIVFTNDENQRNNESHKQAFIVQKDGTELLYAGVNSIPNGDFHGPFASSENSSLVETIYLKDYLVAGELHGISYNYSTWGEIARSISIFIGETELTNLADTGWINATELDLVFEDSIFYGPADDTTLYLPFKTPYLYSGDKNLIVLVHKHKNKDLQESTAFATTKAEMHEKGRGLSATSYHIFDPYNIEESLDGIVNTFQLDYYSNAIFHIKTTERNGLLTGIVYDENAEPFEGAEVNIDGFANTPISNANGEYIFPIAPVGEYQVTASEYYHETDTAIANIIAEESTTLNFNMPLLGYIGVLGKIISNDDLLPVENAKISIHGYEIEHSVTTDNNGIFTIDSIFAHQKYKFTIESPYHNIYLDSILTTNIDLDLGTITIEEKAQPAFHAIANIESDSTVTITWKQAYTGMVGEIDPEYNPTGYSWLRGEPDKSEMLGNLYTIDEPTTITSFTYHNATPAVEITEAPVYFKVFNKDRELLFSVEETISRHYYGWIDLDIPDFTVNEDFYVMVHWDNTGVWSTPMSTALIAENIAWYQDETGWRPLTELGFKPMAISIKLNTIEATNKAETKAIESYNVYKLPSMETDNQSNWVKLTDEPIASTDELIIKDNKFVDNESGFYLYAIETNYTLETSEAVYSNTINKGLFSNVVILATANNGLNVDGTKIRLISTDEGVTLSYTGTVTNGFVIFERVRKGNYYIYATLGGYYPYTSNVFEISDDYSTTIELLEHIYSPANLIVNADAEADTVQLNWGLGSPSTISLTLPNPNGGRVFEAGDEGEFGNLFDIDEQANINKINIYSYDAGGDIAMDTNAQVKLYIYDEYYNFITASEPFKMLDKEWVSVDMNNLKVDGGFFAMVHWYDDKQTAALYSNKDYMETAYYGHVWTPEWGLVPLWSIGLPEVFFIEAEVLLHGNKSVTIDHNNNILENNPQFHVDADELISLDVEDAPVVKKPHKSTTLHYNLYIDDMTTPVAKTVGQEQTFTFTSEYFTEEKEYKAGVSAVYITEESEVIESEAFFMTSSVKNTNLNEVEIFPNPASDFISINNIDINATLEIYNSVGQIVKEVQSKNTNITISVSDLNTGIYTIRIKTSKGSQNMQFIVVE